MWRDMVHGGNGIFVLFLSKPITGQCKEFCHPYHHQDGTCIAERFIGVDRLSWRMAMSWRRCEYYLNAIDSGRPLILTCAVDQAEEQLGR